MHSMNRTSFLYSCKRKAARTIEVLRADWENQSFAMLLITRLLLCLIKQEISFNAKTVNYPRQNREALELILSRIEVLSLRQFEDQQDKCVLKTHESKEKAS